MTQDHTQWLSRPTPDRTGMLDAAVREASLIRDARAAQVAAADEALRVALAEVNRLRDRGERDHDWRPALVLVEAGRPEAAQATKAEAKAEHPTRGNNAGRRLAPCGTYAAYQRHQKRKEDVDPACGLARLERGREAEKTRGPRRPRLKPEAKP